MKQIYILIFTIIISFIILFCWSKYEQFYDCETTEKDNLKPFNIYGITATKNDKLVIKINYNTHKFICYFKKLDPNTKGGEDLDIYIKHFLVINSLSSKFNKIIDITPGFADNQKIDDIKGNKDPNANLENLDNIYDNTHIIRDYITPNETYEMNVILIYIDSTGDQTSINKITDDNKISMSKTLRITASAPKIINNKYTIITPPTNNLFDNLKGKKFNINIK